MDNVIQNISIEDIIPSKFQLTNEEKIKIDELAQLIKKFGLIDPILVRRKNKKYEIILGTDKYQAALKAQLENVPVIIKEVDDEVYSKYSSIDNYNKASSTSLSTETNTNRKVNNNSDTINLAELSKIKIEYERDDFKMNNEQLNNNLEQHNFNQTIQGPTFGDKFFPSLEDEPTNMNMMGEISIPSQSEIPNLGPAPTSNDNLIDLTDLSIEKDNINIPTIDIPAPPMNQAPIEPIMSINNEEIPTNNIVVPMTETPITDNIINLDNLQNNNPIVQSISEPVSMDILNEDFGAPSPKQEDIPQFINPTISQNIEPIQAMNIVQPEMNNNIPTMMSPESPIINPQPSIDINPAPAMNTNFEVPTLEPTQSMMSINNESVISNNVSMSTPEIPEVIPSKDITPVTSTIRSLVSSLGTFGYKINIIEEDLPTSAKMIIEIEK